MKNINLKEMNQGKRRITNVRIITNYILFNHKTLTFNLKKLQLRASAL